MLYVNKGEEPLMTLSRDVLSLRQKSKLLSTYCLLADNNEGRGLKPKNGFIHAQWKPWGPLTNRWSCADPNLQNQPSSMRDMYVAPVGWKFVSADYPQLEGRLMAGFSGDKELCDGFLAGRDLYKMVAAAIYKKPYEEITKPQRQVAKTFWLALSYGSGAESLQGTLRVRGLDLRLDVIQLMLDNIKNTFKGLTAWQNKLIREARENWYVEEPIWGWRRHYHDGKVISTEVKNFPNQAAGAAIVNDSLLRLGELCPWTDWKIIAMIHDEIVCLAKDEAVKACCAALRQTMNTEVPGIVRIPLIVEPTVAQNWQDAKD
jgi:DNA polymerase-1